MSKIETGVIAGACFAFGLGLAVVLFGGGCVAAKPACAVIDVAQTACVLLKYTDADGTTKVRKVSVGRDGTLGGPCR